MENVFSHGHASEWSLAGVLCICPRGIDQDAVVQCNLDRLFVHALDLMPMFSLISRLLLVLERKKINFSGHKKVIKF